MKLGETIKKARVEKNLSIRELSKLSDVNASYISRLERGIDEKPSIEILTKIAEVLNIPINDLMYSDKVKEIFKKADKILDAYNKNGYEDGTRDSISTLLDPEFLVKFKNLNQGIAFDHFKSLLRYCNDFKKLPESKIATERYYKMFLKTIQYIDDELSKIKNKRIE